jgi:hypothetical protein
MVQKAFWVNAAVAMMLVGCGPSTEAKAKMSGPREPSTIADTARVMRMIGSDMFLKLPPDMTAQGIVRLDGKQIMENLKGRILLPGRFQAPLVQTSIEVFRTTSEVFRTNGEWAWKLGVSNDGSIVRGQWTVVDDKLCVASDRWEPKFLNCRYVWKGIKSDLLLIYDLDDESGSFGLVARQSRKAREAKQ